MCTVSTVPAVLANANPAIAVYRYRRTIMSLLGRWKRGPRALATLDMFNVEYTAYFRNLIVGS